MLSLLHVTACMGLDTYVVFATFVFGANDLPAAIYGVGNIYFFIQSIVNVTHKPN